MSVVYVTTMGSSIRRRGDRLQVYKGKQKVQDLRLFDLERLVLIGTVQLTAQAMALLVDRGVDVSFLTATGRLRGSLVSRESRNVYLRLAQFDRWKDAGFRLAFSREVVAAKLGGQLNLLARTARSAPGRIEAEAPERLRTLVEKLNEAGTVDQVRGLEGRAPPSTTASSPACSPPWSSRAARSTPPPIRPTPS